MIYAGAGCDVVHASSGNDFIAGGPGNDILFAGRGNDILVGGDGDDILFGGSGRGLLIGGRGRDLLFAGRGDDVLIGGGTTFDSDRAALMAIMAEWSTHAPIDVRIGHLQNGGGLNGDYRLVKGVTVLDDRVRDLLFGGPGNDWFLAFDSDHILGRNRRSRST